MEIIIKETNTENCTKNSKSDLTDEILQWSDIHDNNQLLSNLGPGLVGNLHQDFSLILLELR